MNQSNFNIVDNTCVSQCLEGAQSRVQWWFTAISIGLSLIKKFWLQTESEDAGRAALDTPSFATGYCVAKCEKGSS